MGLDNLAIDVGEVYGNLSSRLKKARSCGHDKQNFGDISTETIAWEVASIRASESSRGEFPYVFESCLREVSKRSRRQLIGEYLDKTSR